LLVIAHNIRTLVHSIFELGGTVGNLSLHTNCAGGTQCRLGPGV
jgi:hypothetical protein